MKFATAVRLGLARTRGRFGLVLLAYLAALLPALLFVSFVHRDLGASLDKSLFAGDVLDGQRFGVVMDFRLNRDYDLEPVFGGFGSRMLLVLLLQIVVSAGLVEALLGRSAPGERPFLTGVGRHGWRFVRSALGFAALAGVGLAAISAGLRGIDKFAEDRGDGALWFWGTAALLALLVVFLLPAKLGYDLSRIAAASHGDGATFRGLLRAFRHALGRPVVLWPLLLAFAVPGVLLIAGYAAWRDAWDPTGTGTLVLAIAVQQILLFAHAGLRVGLWGAEIAYYQGIGEPRWCLPKPKKAKKLPVAAPAPAPPPAAPEPEALEAEETPTDPIAGPGWTTEAPDTPAGGPADTPAGGPADTPAGEEPETIPLRPAPALPPSS